MKSRALTFNYEIVDADAGDVHVTGYSKHICITHDGRVTMLPESWHIWAGT
jgi:acyl-CoA thioesterase FadM